MNLQLSRLVHLQRLDRDLHTLEQRQRDLPRQLQAAQAPVGEAQRRLDGLQTSLETLTAERRNGERDLSEHEHHIGKMRDRLNELKTNKEYQAHLFELDLAAKKKDALEETILQAMERAETVSKELEDARAAVRDLTLHMETEQARVTSAEATLTDEAAALQRQKQTALETLDTRIAHRYASLKSSLGLVVVAPVRGSTCLGCQLQIPPQLVASVKRADELLTCPYCHRLLYAEEAFSDASDSPDAPPAVPDRLEERVAGERGAR